MAEFEHDEINDLVDELNKQAQEMEVRTHEEPILIDIGNGNGKSNQNGKAKRKKKQKDDEDEQTKKEVFLERYVADGSIAEAVIIAGIPKFAVAVPGEVSITLHDAIEINFDDSHESDYTYAKPILDKYGFKATFFEVCSWIEAGYHDKDISVTWPEIAAMQQDGMDIESHTMTHPDLNHKSQADLNYEIGQSKQCLENHGFNPTVFAYPNGEGSDDPKVVNTVAKYYDS